MDTESNHEGGPQNPHEPDGESDRVRNEVNSLPSTERLVDRRSVLKSGATGVLGAVGVGAGFSGVASADDYDFKFWGPKDYEDDSHPVGISLSASAPEETDDPTPPIGIAWGVEQPTGGTEWYQTSVRIEFVPTTYYNPATGAMHSYTPWDSREGDAPLADAIEFIEHFVMAFAPAWFSMAPGSGDVSAGTLNDGEGCYAQWPGFQADRHGGMDLTQFLDKSGNTPGGTYYFNIELHAEIYFVNYTGQYHVDSVTMVQGISIKYNS